MVPTTRPITGWSVGSPWGADVRTIVAAATEPAALDGGEEPAWGSLGQLLDPVRGPVEAAARRWGPARVGMVAVSPEPTRALRWLANTLSQAVRGPSYAVSSSAGDRGLLLDACALLDEEVVDAAVVIGATTRVAGALLVERHGTSELRLHLRASARANGRLRVAPPRSGVAEPWLPAFEGSVISAAALACGCLCAGVAWPPSAQEPDRLDIHDGAEQLGVELVP